MNTKDTELATLDDVLAESWRLLAKGTTDRRHSFHHPVVSTHGVDGTPKSRVVILRSIDAEAGSIRFHTDIRSGKWRELTANPRISLCFYDENDRTQIRLVGEASLHTSDEISAAAWKAAQRMSRVIYGIEPGPGVKIVVADQFTLSEEESYVASGQANFGVVLVKVMQLEWLFLRQARNRRAVFNFESNERSWLVP